MADEDYIDEAFIAQLKSKDKRWQDIDLALKIEGEINNSIVIKSLLEVANDDAVKALEQLSEVDPTDVKKITSLQASVRRAKIIGNTIEKIRMDALNASKSLDSEGNIKVD